MNKQRFHHEFSILFTATTNFAEDVNSPGFMDKLIAFLQKELGEEVIANCVEFGTPCVADPADLHDLM